jgi:hypothetical protein
MSNRIPALIAGLSTFFLLIALGVIFVFGQMVLLNGATGDQGFTAMSISVVCQSVGLLLAVILARWLVNLLITKFNWNKVLAVIVAVFAGTFLGGVNAFLSIIVSIPLAGIR